MKGLLVEGTVDLGPGLVPTPLLPLLPMHVRSRGLQPLLHGPPS